MVRDLDEDELIGNWTLAGDELEQLPRRHSATKLRFALLLRFYGVHGRFPPCRSETPDRDIAYVARLVDVPASDIGLCVWAGRAVKARRVRDPEVLRVPGVLSRGRGLAAERLAASGCGKEWQADRVRGELLAHLKRERVEPPARDRIHRGRAEVLGPQRNERAQRG